MLRRGVLPSGRKLAVDLSLLLHRGKIAGKSLGSLVSFHSHHASSFAAAAGSSSFSCRALDRALAVHEPSRGLREVEFSCCSTPSSAGAKRRGGGKRHHRDDEAAGYYYNYDAADIAEILNDGGHLFDDSALVVASPSPALWTPPSAFVPSPATRQLRLTDSPFAARDEDAAGVDMKADEFIRRFYGQLRAQQSVAGTPEYYGYATSSCNGYSTRPVAAGKLLK